MKKYIAVFGIFFVGLVVGVAITYRIQEGRYSKAIDSMHLSIYATGLAVATGALEAPKNERKCTLVEAGNFYSEKLEEYEYSVDSVTRVLFGDYLPGADYKENTLRQFSMLDFSGCE